jgi:hypothetical protein
MSWPLVFSVAAIWDLEPRACQDMTMCKWSMTHLGAAIEKREEGKGKGGGGGGEKLPGPHDLPCYYLRSTARPPPPQSKLNPPTASTRYIIVALPPTHTSWSVVALPSKPPCTTTACTHYKSRRRRARPSDLAIIANSGHLCMAD